MGVQGWLSGVHCQTGHSEPESEDGAAKGNLPGGRTTEGKSQRPGSKKGRSPRQLGLEADDGMDGPLAARTFATPLADDLVAVWPEFLRRLVP